MLYDVLYDFFLLFLDLPVKFVFALNEALIFLSGIDIYDYQINVLIFSETPIFTIYLDALLIYVLSGLMIFFIIKLFVRFFKSIWGFFRI